MKKCLGCQRDLLIEQFNIKDKIKNKRQSRCKECTRKQVRTHYSKNRDYYLIKAKKRNKMVHQRLVDFVYNYLFVHPCVDCGIADVRVLEFDHQRDKEDNISNFIKRGVSFDRLSEEIEKCVVRCANCHRIRTAVQFRWAKGLPR